MIRSKLLNQTDFPLIRKGLSTFSWVDYTSNNDIIETYTDFCKNLIISKYLRRNLYPVDAVAWLASTMSLVELSAAVSQVCVRMSLCMSSHTAFSD